MDNQVQTEEKTFKKTYSQNVETLLDRFYHWEKTQPDKAYLKQPEGDKWITYTWGEVGNQARRIAAALRAMNLPPNSNIGLVSKNCAHWIIWDIAVTMSGHVTVPFYPNLIASQLNDLLNHSRCKVLFIGKLDLWNGMKEGVPKGLTCVTFPQYPGSDIIDGEGFLKWDDLINQHEARQENYYPNLSDLRTIVYTSGTTGNPKGVMFDHHSANMDIMKSASKYANYEGETCFFSYLPLCHIAERAFVSGGCMYSGGTIHFAESLDTFAKNLHDTQPTHFLAVPRIWSKFQLGILSKLPQKKLNRLLQIPIVSGLVKKKIRKGLGLSRSRINVTGAAPMPVAIINWYKKLGIHIQEGYGMSENGGGCTFMPKDRVKNGTVGIPYDFVQIRIDPENSEILMKSEGLMLGYYREPEMTAETFKNGWLRTGDMGELDNEGFLKLTGRVKDLFKTSKGEYIAPGPIEWKFAANNDIEQICVAGANLPQPVALIVLSEIGLTKDKNALKESLTDSLNEVNTQLLDYQRLKKIIVVKEPWTIESGILTPTLKIKRNVLEAAFSEKLAKWYDSDESIIFEYTVKVFK